MKNFLALLVVFLIAIASSPGREFLGSGFTPKTAQRSISVNIRPKTRPPQTTNLKSGIESQGTNVRGAKKAVFYLSFPGCAPCRKFKKSVLDDATVKSYIAANCNWAEADSRNFNGRSYPAPHIYFPSENKAYNPPRSPQQFIDFLERHL